MREPELNRDYALVSVYKCWHCDLFEGFGEPMADHIKEKHPEKLNR